MNTYVVTVPGPPVNGKPKHYVIEADTMSIAEAHDFPMNKTQASSVLLFHRLPPVSDRATYITSAYAAFRDWDTCIQVDHDEADHLRSRRVAETLQRIRDGDG